MKKISIASLLSVAFAATSTQAAIVAFEAEIATTLGSNFTVASSIAGSSGSYLSSAGTVGSNSPGSAAAIASYSVNLAAGTYDLYARFYIGPGDASDDSFYAGVGFGTKSPTSDADWYHVNQLGATKNSFTDPDGFEITNQTWVWLNLTDTTTEVENVGSYVSTGGSEIFQYGHREDGFLIDAFAFVTGTETPTVANLDAAVATIPEPSAVLLGSLGMLPLLRRRR